MKLRQTLLRDRDGEPLIHWHWQNLNEKGSGWRKGRAWLYIGTRHTLGLEWVALPYDRPIGATLEFSVGDGDKVSGVLHLLCASLYWSITGMRWVRRLPGVDYKGDYFYNGDRQIGIKLDKQYFWLWPWVNPWGGRKRDTYLKEWATLFFGRAKYSDRILEEGVPVEIVMPEATYQGTAKRYVATWKRPRWPKAKSLMRVEIEVPTGVPIPGKGENAYDMDDDAIFGTTANAETIEDGVKGLIASAMRDRKKYGGGEHWQPE
jgi:hypothetical protein